MSNEQALRDALQLAQKALENSGLLDHERDWGLYSSALEAINKARALPTAAPELTDEEALKAVEELGMHNAAVQLLLANGYKWEPNQARWTQTAAPVDEREASSNLPAGFVPLQKENGRLVYAACLDGGRFHGWLMWNHPDGKWVSKRKLEPWEVMQAEDQDHYGIVQETGKESP